MDAHTIFVHTIIDVSANVIALVNHVNAISSFSQRAGVDGTSEARANNEDAPVLQVSLCQFMIPTLSEDAVRDPEPGDGADVFVPCSFKRFPQP